MNTSVQSHHTLRDLKPGRKNLEMKKVLMKLAKENVCHFPVASSFCDVPFLFQVWEERKGNLRL